jgi:hypothetical protein
MSKESRFQCCSYVDDAVLPAHTRFLSLGLANISSSIVELAQNQAMAFERWVTLKRNLLILKKTMDRGHDNDLLQTISQLKLN